jgi:hypothetical protein
VSALAIVDEIKVLDVVAVTEDTPKHGLRRGEVGTVVERWKDGAPLKSNSVMTQAKLTLSPPCPPNN